MDRGAWWATVHGVARSWTWLSNWHFHFLRVNINILKKCQEFKKFNKNNWQNLFSNRIRKNLESILKHHLVYVCKQAILLAIKIHPFPLEYILSSYSKMTSYFKFCVCVLSWVQLFETPCTVACQTHLSMECSRQEYCSGLPFPSPGDLPDPHILSFLHWKVDSLPLAPLGKPPYTNSPTGCFLTQNTTEQSFYSNNNNDSNKMKTKICSLPIFPAVGNVKKICLNFLSGNVCAFPSYSDFDDRNSSISTSVFNHFVSLSENQISKSLYFC